MSSLEIRQTIELVETLEKQRDERLKSVGKVNHRNTQTTRNTEKLVKKTESELGDIGEEIVKTLSRNRRTPVKKLRDKYGVKVGSIIANGVRESFLLGLHFVEKFGEQTVELTPQSTETMNEIIDDQIERFWKQIGNLIKQQNKKFGIKGGASPKDLALLNAFASYFQNSAISMNYFSLNEGTTTSMKTLFKTQTKLGIVTGKVKVPQMIWVTKKDNKVDTICLNLEGRTWFIDDPKMPRPIKDTHIGCRCRTLPLANGKAFNA